MTLLSTDQLLHALTGMPYPARRWQMAAWADHNCASGEVREALRHLPDREYASFDELINLVEAVERRAATVQHAARHRRSPHIDLTAA